MGHYDLAAITVKIPKHIVPITQNEIDRYWGKMCLARMYLSRRALRRPIITNTKHEIHRGICVEDGVKDD